MTLYCTVASNFILWGRRIFALKFAHIDDRIFSSSEKDMIRTPVKPSLIHAYVVLAFIIGSGSALAKKVYNL